MMRLVMEEFQRLATDRHITIVHEFEAEHQGAVHLVEQLPEYMFSGNYRNGHPIYIKKYVPNTT